MRCYGRGSVRNSRSVCCAWMLMLGTSMFPNKCPPAVSYTFRFEPEWRLYFLRIAQSRPFDRWLSSNVCLSQISAQGGKR
jgi:hypothetical protein